ncbi:MAG TPA: hypothetical protein VIU65_12445 [Pyrinomonadaceae bacterium]
MKSCPTCNRTYPDDTLAFCLVDGAVLSAPYEPEQTQKIPPTRTTNSPATEVLRSSARDSGATPSLQSTIHASPPPLYSPHRTEAQADAPKKSLAPWLILGGAIVIVGILGIVMLARILSAGANSGRSQPASPRSSLNADSPVASSTVANRVICGRTVSAAIYDKWISTGGESGKLGCPVTNEDDAGLSPQGTTGRWIQFTRGDGAYLIEQKTGPNAGKVFKVSGCMYKLYGSLGGTRSWLGFPTGDEYETDPGVRQDFEGGYTVWDRTTYVCEAKKR